MHKINYLNGVYNCNRGIIVIMASALLNMQMLYYNNTRETSQMQAM